MPLETAFSRSARSAVCRHGSRRCTGNRTTGTHGPAVFHNRSNGRRAFRYCVLSVIHRSAGISSHGRMHGTRRSPHSLCGSETVQPVPFFQAVFRSLPAVFRTESNGFPSVILPAYPRSIRTEVLHFRTAHPSGTARTLPSRRRKKHPPTALPNPSPHGHAPARRGARRSPLHGSAASLHFYRRFHAPHRLRSAPDPETVQRVRNADRS